VKSGYRHRILLALLILSWAIGILLSALTLGETVEQSLIARAALITAGIRLAVPRSKAYGKSAPV